MLLIKMTRSMAGTSWRHIATLKALGLRKMHQSVEHDDTPSIRGMIAKVAHMLQVTEVEGSRSKPPARRGKAAKPTQSKAAPKSKAEKVEKVGAATPVVSEKATAKAKPASKEPAKAKPVAKKPAAKKPAAKK